MFKKRNTRLKIMGVLIGVVVTIITVIVIRKAVIGSSKAAGNFGEGDCTGPGVLRSCYFNVGDLMYRTDLSGRVYVSSDGGNYFKCIENCNGITGWYYDQDFMRQALNIVNRITAAMTLKDKTFDNPRNDPPTPVRKKLGR